ncbi:unnamed protein product, partial [Adineta steineri]
MTTTIAPELINMTTIIVPESNNNNPLTDGVIAAIVISSIVASALLGIGSFFIYRYRRTIIESIRAMLHLDNEEEDEEEEEEEQEQEQDESAPNEMNMSPSFRTTSNNLAKKRQSVPHNHMLFGTRDKIEQTPVSLSFHNISYVVKSGNKRRINLPFIGGQTRPKKRSKQVLFDVSGRFESGMNALLGPTGCGKSSLLDVLAARKDPRGLSGRVLVDGLPLPASYKYMVGYIVQDDIISGTLTV